MTERIISSDTAPSTMQTLTNRALLTGGCGISILLFLGIARQFHIPAQPGFSASLLQQHWGLVSLLIVAVTFVVATLVSSIIVGSIHRDAGLFCAAVGLVTISWRGGPMRYVLFDASDRNVFLILAAETIALGAILALAWTILDYWPMSRRRVGVEPDSRDQKYLATVAHGLIMIGLMSLLARTDSKVQVLASVGVSSWLAVWGSQWIAQVGPSPWLWSSPLFVALLGYLSCYFSPGGMEVGRTSGYFAALGRALPLDYASMGVAGALIGYWSGLRRNRESSVQSIPE